MSCCTADNVVRTEEGQHRAARLSSVCKARDAAELGMTPQYGRVSICPVSQMGAFAVLLAQSFRRRQVTCFRRRTPTSLLRYSNVSTRAAWKVLMHMRKQRHKVKNSLLQALTLNAQVTLGTQGLILTNDKPRQMPLL